MLSLSVLYNYIDWFTINQSFFLFFNPTGWFVFNQPVLTLTFYIQIYIMLKLNIKERPKIEVTIPVNDESLTVVIQPLPKQEDIALEKKYRGGDIKIMTGRKKSKNQEIKIPDRDYYSLNLDRAKKTWESWNLLDEGANPIECNNENIELVFSNYYDILVLPILDKYDELMDAAIKEEDEQEEEEEKN
jgi:hypothetical protein